MYPEETNPMTQKILIFAGVGILLLLFVIFVVVSMLSKAKQSTTQSITPSPAPIDNSNSGQFAQLSPSAPKKAQPPVPGAIAKVGEEIIYNSDLNEEIASYPNSDDPAVREKLFQKIINDSITLQGAKKLNLITLDDTIYNSLSKDYTKRIAAVADAKKKLDDNSDGYSGIVDQIWFYNQKPPAIGYAQARQITLQKITALHDQVKSGTMTMEQAGEAIRNDESLYDIDQAFKINASFTFTATKENPATFDTGFNIVLAGLKEGEISDIYTAKDKDQNDNLIDAVYMFGRVDKKINTSGYTSYTDWLSKQKKLYVVTTY